MPDGSAVWLLFSSLSLAPPLTEYLCSLLCIFILFCLFLPFFHLSSSLIFYIFVPVFFSSPFPLSAYLMYILWTQRGHIVVTIFMFCMCAVPNLVFIQCISALSSQSSHPNNGNIPIVHHLFTATVFHLVLIISYTLLPGKDVIRHSLVNKIKNQLYLL